IHLRLTIGPQHRLLDRLTRLGIGDRIRCVDLPAFLLAVLSDDAHDALGCVDVRNEIDQDAACMTDGASQIVRKVECRNIALTLHSKNGADTGFIRASSQGSVVTVDYGLQVVSRVGGFLEGPCGRTTTKRLALWPRRPVIL